MTRVLDAGRISLLIGFGTALAATVVGAGLGLLAGGRGGWVDSLLARVADLFLIVPAFVVLIVLSLTLRARGVRRRSSSSWRCCRGRCSSACRGRRR